MVRSCTIGCAECGAQCTPGPYHHWPCCTECSARSLRGSYPHRPCCAECLRPTASYASTESSCFRPVSDLRLVSCVSIVRTGDSTQSSCFRPVYTCFRPTASCASTESRCFSGASTGSSCSKGASTGSSCFRPTVISGASTGSSCASTVSRGASTGSSCFRPASDLRRGVSMVSSCGSLVGARLVVALVRGVMSCRVMSCHVASRQGHVTSCYVVSCHITSRRDAAEHVLTFHPFSCYASRLWCGVVSCSVRSFFLTPCHTVRRVKSFLFMEQAGRLRSPDVA